MSDPVGAPRERPESFTVTHHGEPFVFTRLKDGQGYGYQYPPGGAMHWIDTESGTRHRLSFDGEGRATIVGSLAHDGFHVVVENGVMRDV